MPKRNKHSLSFIKKLKLLEKSGIGDKQPDGLENYDETVSLEKRIQNILGLFDTQKRKAQNMIYFIMYDIESNKVRPRVAKYLESMGCIRVQKSIFIADTDRKVFDEIHQTLIDVQQSYRNNDSLFLVPVSVDEISAMKIIGKNVDFDMVTKNPTTLFF